jgi:hypothetical protein
VIANVLAVLQVMGYVVQPAQEVVQIAFSATAGSARQPHWWTRDGDTDAGTRGWRRALPGLFRG